VKRFTRLRPRPEREAVSEDQRGSWDMVVERTGRIHGHDSNPANYFNAALNAPSLAEGLVRMGTLVRQGQVRGAYTDAERELIDFVYGEDFDYRGHYTVHLPDAFACGTRPEAIAAIREGREDEVLTDEEKLIADHARRVAAGTVTDESWGPVADHFGEQGAVEFTIFCGFLVMTLRLWSALGVPDLEPDEVDELFNGLLDGTIPIPSAEARIG
jgi:hypothetical protein